ncbi:hypothetical protein Tco_0403736 [Tanacetum coccineum]
MHTSKMAATKKTIGDLAKDLETNDSSLYATRYACTSCRRNCCCKWVGVEKLAKIGRKLAVGGAKKGSTIPDKYPYSPNPAFEKLCVECHVFQFWYTCVFSSCALTGSKRPNERVLKKDERIQRCVRSHFIDEKSGLLDTVGSPMTRVPKTEQVVSSGVGARVANTLEAKEGSNGQVTAATYAALGNLNHSSLLFR